MRREALEKYGVQQAKTRDPLRPSTTSLLLSLIDPHWASEFFDTLQLSWNG
jgi:hypothetical protein